MAIYTHIFATEHSGSSAFGKADDYLKELVAQAEESGEDNLVIVLADYFSMASVIPFYSACTKKDKYNDKIKPVIGLKITIQADENINFVVSEGDYLLSDDGKLLKEENDFYTVILDNCTVSTKEDLFTISQKKVIIIDDTNKETDEGRKLLKDFTQYNITKPLFNKDHDLIVIAKDDTGRRNINNLISKGYQIELNSNYKRVNFLELAKYSNGLMAISGGLYGAIENAVEQNNIDLAKKRLDFFETIFDKDDFYLQIKRIENTVSGQEREEKVISSFKILEKEGYQLLASNDVRFPKKSNYKEVVIRKKAIEKKELYDPSDIVDITEEQYLKPTMEMVKLFEDTPMAIANTIKMANKTDLSNFRNKLYRSFLPKFPIPADFDKIDGISQSILDMEDSPEKEKEIIDYKSSNYLRFLAYKGLDERWELIKHNQNFYIGELSRKGILVTEEFLTETRQKYEDQIEMELDVIHRTGFPGYFLIVQDVVVWCKQNDISVGPGRGSGAGSIVLYCLMITDIDSIEYDLLFERFLNPERVGEPDIDMDFSPRNRQKVIKYMAERYGKENTAQILTHGTMAAKDVVDNIGRVIGMQPEERDRIKALISSDPGTKLKNELDEETGNEKLIKLRNSSPIIDSLLTSALILEGSTKSYGKHAGGVVVSYGEMDQYAGLYQEAKDQGVTADKELLEELNEAGEDVLVPIVQTDKNLCEYVGLIKFDFLGLKNLDIRDDCIKFIRENSRGMEDFDASKISPHDKKALELFKRADTYGIFQFESPSMRKLMKDLDPDNFEEVIALVALFRPGPLKSGMTSSFVDRKHGREKLIYPHEDLSELLKTTYGTIIYQEQVMTISRILAGFTRGEADTLRKAMGKKIFEIMQKMRKLFAEGAAHKYADKTLQKTTEKLKSSIDSSKSLPININLIDVVHPLKDILFPKSEIVDEEHIQKTIGKFGYYGKFISTKEQVLEIFKYFNVLTEDELEELDVKIDTMKINEFSKLYKTKLTDKGINKLKEEGFSIDEAELLVYRFFVGSSIFVRFNNIFSSMNEFAAYGFNASHSVAYATVSMHTAYLKAHYPSQYMAALLSNESSLEKLAYTARECRRMGLNILRPDINDSEIGFVALSGKKKEKNIRYGLGLIKGIAKKAKPIIELREKNGKINDIYEFYNVFANYKTKEIVKKKGIVKEQQAKVINKTILESLLNAGALDSLCPDNKSNYRSMLLSTYYHIEETFTDVKKRLKKNLMSIKRACNNKKVKLESIDIINSLSDKTKELMDLNKLINSEEWINSKESDRMKKFITKLEITLVPDNLITDLNTDLLFDIYNVVENKVVNKSLKESDFLLELENIDIDTTKYKGLSFYMLLSYGKSSFVKYEKALIKIEKDLSKKSIKSKEKNTLSNAKNEILSSNDYKTVVLLNNIMKALEAETDKKKQNIIDIDNNVLTIFEKYKETLKQSMIFKLEPIFNLITELKSSHTGEEIELANFTVNGIENTYVLPSTKENESIPLLNTKERTIKEFEVTGMYQTTHPLLINALKDKLKDDLFNIVPLNSILPIIAQKGFPSKKNPQKHYWKTKIAGSVLDVNDFRRFNEKNNRMETSITLVIDDGTGIVTAKFAAEDIFTSGREDAGIKLLFEMKKKRSEVILLEGSLTQGNYESEGAVMYVDKLGSANPDLYLPVENNEFNAVEEVKIASASPAQIKFVRSLIYKSHDANDDEIFELYGIKSYDELTVQQASELITLYKK